MGGRESGPRWFHSTWLNPNYPNKIQDTGPNQNLTQPNFFFFFWVFWYCGGSTIRNHLTHANEKITRKNGSTTCKRMREEIFVMKCFFLMERLQFSVGGQGIQDSFCRESRNPAKCKILSGEEIFVKQVTVCFQFWMGATTELESAPLGRALVFSNLGFKPRTGHWGQGFGFEVIN